MSFAYYCVFITLLMITAAKARSSTRYSIPGDFSSEILWNRKRLDVYFNKKSKMQFINKIEGLVLRLNDVYINEDYYESANLTIYFYEVSLE
jgi:hypothetical protein